MKEYIFDVLFQFHDGAIGSVILFAAALRSYLFQFHDGAIGS